MFAIQRKTLVNMRLVAVLIFGFSAGLPLALIGSTLQAWFTEAHVNLMSIGMLSLVGLPYTLKFVWAPMMDYFSLPWLGLRRGWIIITQACLALSLLIFAQMDPQAQFTGMGYAAFLIAFLSASQDIAIDAYRTDVLASQERGLGAAYYVFTYRIATFVSGGGALVYADYFGWKATYEAMAGLLFLCMIPAYYAPRVVELKKVSASLFKVVIASLHDLLQREKIIWIFLFLVFYKFGDALALQLITNFLLHGLGFSLTEVGLAYKLVSLIAMISGALLGGLMLTRWNIYRALLTFGLLQAFSNLMFVILVLSGKQFMLMVLSIFIENFCSGLSTAALLAFMMSLCHHSYTASQFALLSAITSLGRVFLGPVASMMVEHLGWLQLFTWSFFLSFPGIIFLLLLRSEVSAYAPVTAD